MIQQITVFQSLTSGHLPLTLFLLSSWLVTSRILSKMASSVGPVVPQLPLSRAATFSLNKESWLREAAAASRLASRLFSNSQELFFKRLSSCFEASQTRWPASSLSWRILTSLSRTSLVSTAQSKS